MCPPLRTRSANGNIPVDQVDVDAKYHRHETDYGRHCGQQDWPKTDRASPDDCIYRFGATSTKYVECINEDDVVVDDDSCKRDDTDARHDDAERLVHDQVPKQYAACRKNDGRQNQCGLVDAVELRNENDGHDCQRHQHGLHEKGLVFLLVLRTAAECDADPWVDVERRQYLAKLGNHIRDQVIARHVGIDAHRAPHVSAPDRADLLCRHALDKCADRNETVPGRNA